MKVLVVEDDAETAAYIVRGLREHGHAVDHAADGQDGLVIAAGSVRDVLVVDRMLPGLDGLGLVRTLCAADRLLEFLMRHAARHPGEQQGVA